MYKHPFIKMISLICLWIIILYPTKVMAASSPIWQTINGVKFQFTFHGTLSDALYIRDLGGYVSNCICIDSIADPNTTMKGDFTFPYSVQGYRIRVLKYSACVGQQELTSVSLPIWLDSIQQEAFRNCPKLESVYFGSATQIKYLSYGVFQDCVSLKNITIPNTVTTIESYAFKGCESLETLQLPKRVTSIEGGAFKDCSSLKTINLPDGIETISFSLFENCTSLEKIVIPDSVTTIEGSAFKGCTALKEIHIPEGVTSIGNNAFKNCTNLEEIIIPASVTSIGEYAFENCSNLKKITISNEVETNLPNREISIYNSSFKSCSNLESIILPYKITVAESSTHTYRGRLFGSCTKLKEIHFPGTKSDFDEGFTSLFSSSSLSNAIVYYNSKGTITGIGNGDTNGDGLLNTKDRMLLSRYLANWPEYSNSVVEAFADVNLDGVVNTKDRMILSRHLANWPGYETLPYVK